ncbi:MAG: radical SAM protein [Candidatus Ozemobacteraceae bacterium]
MNIDIIVVSTERYRRGHELNFVPPITGLHLAALTPPQHNVRVIHQQVEAIDFTTDANLIALSFFTGFAPEAFRIARLFKERGKTVVGGGPHLTFTLNPDPEGYFDAIVRGEAESVWSRLLDDFERGILQKVYQGISSSLDDLPTPRYDLLSPRFFVQRVVQATRGCPFSCTFCSVPRYHPGFRMRPVESVLRDIAYESFPRWWQRKMVWFWDDNLTAHRPWAKELMRAMIPFRRWWLTQASLDIADDSELLGLMRDSGCIGVFFGIESFSATSLHAAGKSQNRSSDYYRRVKALHDHGICVMAGLISGLDGDTPRSIAQMASQLDGIEIDVPFLSILTPYHGTPLYEKFEAEGRLLPERGYEHFNGYNVAFRPHLMTPAQLLEAHRRLWSKAFSLPATMRRLRRAATRLRPGAFLLSALMNGFYSFKAMTGNLPKSFPVNSASV